MSEVIFNPEPRDLYSRGGRPKVGWVASLFMKLFGLRDEATANRVMVVTTLIFLVAATIILIKYL